MLLHLGRYDERFGSPGRSVRSLVPAAAAGPKVPGLVTPTTSSRMVWSVSEYVQGYPLEKLFTPPGWLFTCGRPPNNSNGLLSSTGWPTSSQPKYMAIQWRSPWSNESYPEYKASPIFSTRNMFCSPIIQWSCAKLTTGTFWAAALYTYAEPDY